ncbi:hypothetical protein D0864_16735, partial [Hortaea werneckii]
MNTAPEMQEKPLEHEKQEHSSGSSSPDRRHVEDNMTHEERMKYERDKDRPEGWRGSISKLGNLPEWKFGKKKLQGKPLNISIAWAAACGFLMFDQGVLSALLTLDDFQKSLPLMTPRSRANDLCWLDAPTNTIPDPNNCTGDSNTQAAGVAIYQIGCFMGAVLILFYGETWGRKSSTFYGSIIMIIGTILQAAAHDYGTLIAGRIIGGIGNGMVTSTIPTWQSECAKPENRGRDIVTSGATIVFGIMIAYWVDYGFYFIPSGRSYSSVRWRFPIMFQSFFTLLVMWALLYLPDSPRWLLMRGRPEEARDVLARLQGNELDSEEVDIEMQNIKEALEVQSRGGGFKMRELLHNGPSQNLRRTILGITSQFFQQICGINLITYYATYVFENSLGFGPDRSRLLSACNGTEYFLAALIAVPLIEKVGRRKLML